MEIKVPGFRASGIAAGIKKGGEKDLALLFSEKPAVAAGVFTTNEIKAAPVIITQDKLRGGMAQAIIVNSGNANACTGSTGFQDANNMTEMIGRELSIEENLVLVSSTGIIGVPLPMSKITASLGHLLSSLSDNGINDFAEAIMTTDTFPKVITERVALDAKEVTICGIAKGSGMVMPSMATLLSFIITDAAIRHDLLLELLKEAIDTTYNSLTIDGETSTNDMTIIMANGYAENKNLTKKSPDYSVFKKALFSLLKNLATLILQDAEGSTKIVHVFVKHALSVDEGKRIAYSVANSILVKTALYGEDPNWGRIMSAIGKVGAGIDPGNIDIIFDDVPIVKKSTATGEVSRARDVLRRPEFQITIDLHRGKTGARVSTVDLSAEYVRINSDYPT